MGSITQKLMELKKITPPDFLRTNIMYECYMGSFAYGVSTDLSDTDVYGYAVPPKEYMFPHLIGAINGFGNQGPTFDQYQQHHIDYKEREYDISIYSITRYFHLCMKCNPNMIDSMFVKREHIIHSTAISELVREKRHSFLSKLAYPKFKGYAYSQLHKIKTKKPDGVAELVDFEKENDIPHTTSFDDVEKELKKRGLLSE